MSEPEGPTGARTIGFIADNNGHILALAKVPTLLHVSGETRRETLKNYQLCFSEVYSGKPLYINFKIDRLFIYTIRTFRRFFVDDGNLNNAWRMDAKKLSNETPLLLNFSSSTIPEFVPNVGFKNLKTLVMPQGKGGTYSWR